MKALVTGAGGQIGTVLSLRLRERGDEVRALALPGERVEHLEALGVEIVRGNIEDGATLRGIADGCDQVFHLAARVEDWGSRDQFRRSHYDGTQNVLRESVGKVDRFVYLSSAGYYGSGEHLGATEDKEPVLSGFPYPDMKVLCERLIETTAVETGLEYTMIRATNVLSPRSPYVRNLLDTFLRGPVPLIDEGSFSASFVHVENLVDGILLAADSPRAVNRAYNFCDDYTVTWREYMTQLGALVGKKPSTSLTLKAAKPLAIAAEVAAAPFRRRPLFSRYSLFIIGQTWHLSTARAREELGWSTRITWEQAWAEIEQFVTDTYPQARATTRTPHPERHIAR